MAGNAPVQVPAADITVSQSVDKTSANPGNKVTFTVTVKNNGPGTATNVQIRDVIPSELLNVVITPSAGTYNSATGIWSIGNMESGASAFLRITGTIKSNVNINNTASRIETGTYYDAVISNDLASSSVVVVQDPSNGVVNAAESVKTVPMQKTGVPLQYIVMAVLMVLGGVLVPRKK
nr:DUF11 domain-containing protein [Methanobacterium aggregans]